MKKFFLVAVASVLLGVGCAAFGPGDAPAPTGTEAPKVETDTPTSPVSVAPKISAFTPASGPVGASVTIIGTDFVGTLSVKFQAVTATVVSSTTGVIKVTVPTGARTGPISVTTSGGTAISSTKFTVTVAPTPSTAPSAPSSGGKSSTGQPCVLNSACDSGMCQVAQSGGKVCTSVPSCAGCEVANDAGTGCVAANVGSDPKADCATELSSSCGNTGVCDGAGACQAYASGTMCGSASCTNLGYARAPACDGAGTCAPGSVTICDDGNACTSDACDASAGCTHAPVSCDDANACTTDACSASSGCFHEPLSGTQCGTNGQCGDGRCYE